MRQSIISLKQRIEENKQELHERYGSNCQLLEPTLNMLNLLVSENVPEETVKLYLKDMAKDIKIIENKIDTIQKLKR
jgi:transcription antitermination factor NusA-like protein